MADEHEIDFDPKLKLLRLTLRGFWNEESARQFNDQVRTVLQSVAGPGREPINILVDARAFSVQSQAVMVALDSMAAHFPPRRLALVLSGSVLQRMQTERVGDISGRRIFDTLEPALEWVKEK